MKKLVVSIFATMATVVLLLPILQMGCSPLGISGSGNLITEQKDYSDFTLVEINSAFEYTITKSDTFSVSITADDNIMPHVSVTKDGNRLKVTLGNVSLRNAHYEANITMPVLSGLLIDSASRGSAEGFNSSDPLALTVKSASRLTMVDITAGAVTANVNSASTVTGTLNASSLNLNDSGASTVQITGSATEADLIVGGASKATLNVSGTLDINADGASTVQYTGGPTIGTLNVGGASTVSAL
jgi:hypothetical protein